MEQKNGLRAYELEADGSDLKAISHFKNAISIKPDLVESYKSLSIAQYNNNDIESAIETLEVIESKENVSPDVFQSLGFLHLEVGNPEESIRYYKKADQEPIKNKSIAYGLVNAYISQNRTYEAVSFLSEIVVEFPNDSKLHNVYGTQLYEQVSELFVSLRTSYAQNDTTNATNLRVEIEGVSEKAENELIEAYKMENTNIDYVESLAVFYNNMAGNYFTVYEVAFQEDKNVINTKAIELTDFAITYYSKLLELNPDSNNYSVKLENLKNLKASWTEQE
jgi:tetratricopeptide (TPR) repeat protein